MGCGGVGLAVIQGCRIAGALQIIAVDVNASRPASALSLGATHVVDSSEVDDPVAAVVELSKGGVEFSFDAAGVGSTTTQAFSMTRILGTCTAVGVTFGKTIEVPGTLLQMERKLQGCIAGSTSFRVDLPRWFEFYRQVAFVSTTTSRSKRSTTDSLPCNGAKGSGTSSCSTEGRRGDPGSLRG